jgi:hypothetical protein
VYGELRHDELGKQVFHLTSFGSVVHPCKRMTGHSLNMAHAEDDFLPPHYAERLEEWRKAEGHETSERWRHMDQILPGLFLGPDAYRCLAGAFDVSLVVSVLAPTERADPDYRPVVCAEHMIDLDDDPRAPLTFELLIDAAFRIHAVLREGKRVFVHCAYGRSRSVAVCAAYLIASGVARTAEAAIAQIKEERPCVRPNQGFVEALTRMQGELYQFIL